MRHLRHSISGTLDGCIGHPGIPAVEESLRHSMESIAQADALLLGRLS